jgi:hypothetical protein
VGGVRASLALLLFLLDFECLLTGFAMLLLRSFLNFKIFQFGEWAIDRRDLMVTLCHVQIDPANFTKPFA